MGLIHKIIKLEWDEFQGVHNEGGRASCQDDWENFYIFRSCQFEAWSEELLRSYYCDLLLAEEKNWNLLTEKYARMMESTAPEEYEKLRDKLPPISEHKYMLIDKIVQIQVQWEAEFCKSFPKLAGQGRPINSAEDQDAITSFETYLKGELKTYSESTIKLYYEYVERLKDEEKNISLMIMENTVRAQGYDSMESAEKSIEKYL